jgi:hypothetical protein
MAELPLYSKGIYTPWAIDGIINLNAKRGESKGIVVIPNVISELFCFYAVSVGNGKRCTVALVGAIQQRLQWFWWI